MGCTGSKPNQNRQTHNKHAKHNSLSSQVHEDNQQNNHKKQSKIDNDHLKRQTHSNDNNNSVVNKHNSLNNEQQVSKAQKSNHKSKQSLTNTKKFQQVKQLQNSNSNVKESQKSVRSIHQTEIKPIEKSKISTKSYSLNKNPQKYIKQNLNQKTIQKENQNNYKSDQQFKKKNKNTLQVQIQEQDGYLGMESKVEKSQINRQKSTINKQNSIINEKQQNPQLDQSKSMTKQQKKNQQDSFKLMQKSKSPRAQHNQKLNATVHHNTKQKMIQRQQNLYNSQRNIVTRNYAFQQQEFRQNQTGFKQSVSKKSGKLYEVQQNNLNKSTKSQFLNKKVKILQQNQTQNNNRHNFNKKQYFSVIQNKKDIGMLAQFDKNAHQRTLNKQRQSNHKQEYQNIDRQEDYLIQQNDQEGIVKTPAEISYHTNSKQNIGSIQQISSKKNITSSTINAADKYLKDLQNKIINQRPQKEQSQHSLSSSKQYLEAGHRKQSRVDTAFFKTVNDKNYASSQKQNQYHQNSLQRSKQKPKDFSSSKKKGPIMFSQISFEKDSDCVPDEQRCNNDLGLSIHLNINPSKV